MARRRPARSLALTGLLTTGVTLAALGSVMSSSGAAAPSADEIGRGASHATAAAPADQGLNPTALPQGPAPKRGYLVGRQLHKAGDGKVITVKLPPATARYLTLLGGSPRGFVVLHQRPNGLSRVYAVQPQGKKAGKATLIRSSVGDYRLSHQGSRLLERREATDGSVTYTVYSIYGKQVARLSEDDVPAGDSLVDSQAADFDGKRAVIGSVDWTIGKPVRSLGAYYEFADIAHHLLFVYDSDPMTDGGGAYTPTVGPTSLDDPGMPRWTKYGDNVETVSPDGKLVVTSAQDRRSQSYATLDVRNLSNGASRSERTVVYDDLGWEGSTHVLFVGYDPNTGKSTIVRCVAVGGGCQRTTAVFPSSAHVSLATQ